MDRLYVLIFLSFISLPLFGQKRAKQQKPQVLVYGHCVDAFSAAMQAAQSGVETLWVVDSSAIGGDVIMGGNKKVSANKQLDVGTWALFLTKLANAEELADSTAIAAKNNIPPRIAQNTLEAMSDTINRLQLKKNSKIAKVQRSGKGWQVQLDNGEKIKVLALIDASVNSDLYQYVHSQERQNQQIKTTIPFDQQRQVDYSQTIYRTGVVVGNLANDVFTIPMASIFPDSIPNYFATRSLEGIYELLDDPVKAIPLLMLQAQACGAAAAYCAFFKTTTDKINVRTLQGELLAFKSFIIPFQDIPLQDPHCTAIQRVGATGILQGVYTTSNGVNSFMFQPDSLVSSKEIEPIIEQLYTRSQIWFKGKDIPVLKLKDLLNLIKYVANRGDELDAEIEKGWSKRFKFDQSYDLGKELTRRELAVLIDTYLQPFNVRVTNTGVFQY
ncbi:FAD-dependent oxidoreductase [Olivibacter sp. SDN3]|uniref:FAD-dependent oxidoreductase n=1 Tax=Olivibacter sp. SDN3 TaxID=2764720 RepID=UPI001651913C|nr:FAD-dependent oxidoreductase [Olivibacter sp. SDN3]QNL51309.1 FAD-dependent oxidoreductase [Olivibacter sp. SDN3]